MDLSKLKITDWLVAGGTLAFLVAMFLPWFKVDAEGLGGFGDAPSANGWDYAFFGILPLLLLLAAVAVLVLPKVADGVNVPATIGPLPQVQAALIATAAAAVIVLLRLILGFEEDVPEGLGFEVNRGIGLFIAFIAAAVATAGAVMKYQGKEPDGSAPGGGTAPPTPF